MFFVRLIFAIPTLLGYYLSQKPELRVLSAELGGHTRPSSTLVFPSPMLRVLIPFALVYLIQPASANERTQAQQQFDATNQNITELKGLLGRIQEEKHWVQKGLRGTETEMGKLEKHVQNLQEEIKNSESELERLNAEKENLQIIRVELQKLIAIQARVAYQSGRQEYLKLFLNQQSPAKLTRILTYYDYLSKARLEQLKGFNETLRQLHNVERKISHQQSQLLDQKKALDDHRDQLDKVHKERKKALAKLNKDLMARAVKLQAREQEQAELAKVIKTIEDTLARQALEAERGDSYYSQEHSNPGHANYGTLVSRSGGAFGGPFASARGKLSWPVNGRILARFGETRGNDTRARWDGVMIRTSNGSKVHAIYSGRVVFADWLRGSGLLVILDHGHGYLSLYGHNQTLLKSLGDVVKYGESISTVGNSGGQDTPALYFDIRHQGRPIDPAQWCRTQR